IESPATVALGTIGLTAASYFTYRRYFKRIPTTAYLTPSSMRSRNTIVGKCVSVGDADGFRIYHTPGPIIYRHLLYANIKKGSINGHSNGKGSSFNTQTISVRLAGADAPESSHFGKPSQPFSKEAKEELESLVLGKEVWCQMAHIDQYQRLVATPYVWHSPYIFGRTNVSLRLVEKGLATVYSQAGAAYGTAGPITKLLRKLLIPLSGEARLRRAMARAKRKKIGVWSLKNFETPEDYKKRMKQQS
ncbi:SNase-domain-containing protein, partial [Meira miltonrushii]